MLRAKSFAAVLSSTFLLISAPFLATQAESTTLKMAHWLPPIHHLTDDYAQWAKSINAASGGTLTIKVDKSRLGKPPGHRIQRGMRNRITNYRKNIYLLTNLSFSSLLDSSLNGQNKHTTQQYTTDMTQSTFTQCYKTKCLHKWNIFVIGYHFSETHCISQFASLIPLQLTRINLLCYHSIPSVFDNTV